MKNSLDLSSFQLIMFSVVILSGIVSLVTAGKGRFNSPSTYKQFVSLISQEPSGMSADSNAFLVNTQFGKNSTCDSQSWTQSFGTHFDRCFENDDEGAGSWKYSQPQMTDTEYVWRSDSYKTLDCSGLSAASTYRVTIDKCFTSNTDGTAFSIAIVDSYIPWNSAVAGPGVVSE